ncbi:MAG: ubiquinol-cytochrome c reductase cytochrome b subunit [Actinobacteria bacterium]|nr:ubiquinol-cytochrome c reductase cytochrome b subunit [Actinomycetota bacterium]
MSTQAAQGPTRPQSRTRPARKDRKGSAVDRSLNWIDDRLGVSKAGRTFMDKIFPDHWSFMLGEIALYSFVVLVATGIFLTLYYIPSSKEVIYHGSYLPLKGRKMSEAYLSTVNLSLKVRFGLVMRQAHHWAADVFVGAIAVHMCRVFFTGAFRRPRELNWAVGVTLLTLAIVNGFIGYSLPGDLISGTGLRIMFSIILSIPLIGTYLAFFLFGGNYPGNGIIIPRLFIIHVLIVPAIIAALIGAHLFLLVRQKHTQFAGPGRREDNVVGSPMWPNFMLKTTGFQAMVAAVLLGLGAFAQINPIWQFGPYVPYKVSYAVQPDWYMAWLDGALRIMPSWEFAGFGHTIPLEVTLPAVVLPGLTFGLFYAWPFLEARFTGDYLPHHILDRPRDRPRRTGLGAGILAFYFVLFGASSTDVLANYLHVSLNAVLWSFRVLVFVVPVIVGFLAYEISKELAALPDSGKRKRAMIVERTPQGEYLAEPAEPRPGDGTEELEPEPVPVHMPVAELVGSGSLGDETGTEAGPAGVRQVER